MVPLPLGASLSYICEFPVGTSMECPSCKEAIVGTKVPKEGQFICYPNDTEGGSSVTQIGSSGSLPSN